MQSRPASLRKTVCDIRYSLNYCPNSVTAAEHASKDLGHSRVLISVLYSPAADEDDEDCFLLPPPLSPEYDLLQATPWSSWYYEFVINRQFSVPDLLEEVLSVEGISQLWVSLSCAPQLFHDASAKLRTLVPDEIEIVLVGSSPLPSSLPEGVSGCDPTGAQKYRLLSRPESISEDAALIARHPPIEPGTFALDGHPCAEYHAVSIA